eukprot:1418277-Amphidinium_carterae.3
MKICNFRIGWSKGLAPTEFRQIESVGFYLDMHCLNAGLDPLPLAGIVVVHGLDLFLLHQSIESLSHKTCNKMV